MKCQNCGSFIRDDSKFCNYCGQKVNIRPQRQETPGVSTRPRDEDFDVAVTIQKETEADIAEQSKKSAWVILAMIAAGAIFAGISILIYSSAKANQHVIVTEPSTEATTEAATTVVSSETESLPEETEAPSTEEPTESATPVNWELVDTGTATYQVFDDWVAVITYLTSEPIIVMPDEFQGKPIKIIADGVFENNGTIMYIQLPAHLTALNNRCFANCKNLREIVMPETLKQLGADVFKDTTGFRIVSKEGTFAQRLAEQMELEWVEGDTLTVPVIE